MSEKIGIYVCECGPNIASKVDIEKIMQELAKLEDYKDKELVIKNHKLLCSVEGKKFLEDEINENNLTHLVCAACSPRDHDTTFINVCKKTELNPYLYQIVNIREQCAWIIPDKEEATSKAIRMIHGGMDRVMYQQPLEEKQLDSNPDVLIIGGGIAGMEAAITLASKDRAVYLIEKTDKLGGKSAKLKELLPRQGVTLNNLQQKISDVQSNRYIKVFTNTELDSIVGFLGNFEIVIKNVKETDNTTELLAGAVVVATGFDLTNISSLDSYNSNKEDEIYNALEIEEMLLANGKITMQNGNEPTKVALIHCVGRPEVGYCSKTCCDYLLKIAKLIKDQSPTIEVTELYKHMCLPNKHDEEFYEQVQGKGVDFIKIKNAEVHGTTINLTDITDAKKKLDVDMIIVGTAMVPAAGTAELGVELNIDQHETGFFQEAHLKINPISTNTDGVFVVGGAHGPVGISESMLQAQAAAGKIFTQLIPGQKIIPEVKVSEILEAYCTGCQTCLEVCGFGAIYFDEDKGISVVNEAICRGCGNCVGSCPSGSIRTRHFTNPQLYQEVKEALR
ncbi:MAG: CoB--CoM heterodisulfide reductase iron-sulfur subunit A family protein [Candidatus Cloacimonetes bacterium]|jgi:heterodisulfide reductase subunit A|nr:CoB--CoM heterodisulfide reductase iron-sulfur subunit A family protein [Candidatus Cloacimonadota bacterium]MBT4332723.1 CoB--CoM heterodisulfide reductase iron-sulfur subunit A family protein [Candidatus Cloacimonadota bacterium]